MEGGEEVDEREYDGVGPTSGYPYFRVPPLGWGPPGVKGIVRAHDQLHAPPTV